MNFSVITAEQYDSIMETLSSLKLDLSIKQKNPKEVIFDSIELMKVLNISKSTLQKLRDDGFIGFSQVMGKIFYTQHDINMMIERNYKPSYR